MLKLVIADDDNVFAEYLQKCIHWQELGIRLVARASNGSDAVALVLEHSADILITDIEMPGMNGLDCIQQIKALNCKCEILLITGHSNFKYAQSAAKYGVTNILLKPASVEQLNSELMQLRDRCYCRQIEKLVLFALTHGESNDDFSPVESENYADASLPAICAQIMGAVVKSNQSELKVEINKYLRAVNASCYFAAQLSVIYSYPVLLSREVLKRNAVVLPQALIDVRSVLTKIQQSDAQGTVAETVFELCSEAAQALSKRGDSENNKLAQEMYSIIQQNYSDPNFCIKTISEHLHFHEAYLRRVFLAEYKIAPGTALRNIRMNEAKRLLESGDISVRQVAFMVGYNDPAYFSRCYKIFFGKSAT